jgi:hypothetical protein
VGASGSPERRHAQLVALDDRVVRRGDAQHRWPHAGLLDLLDVVADLGAPGGVDRQFDARSGALELLLERGPVRRRVEQRRAERRPDRRQRTAGRRHPAGERLDQRRALGLRQRGGELRGGSGKRLGGEPVHLRVVRLQRRLERGGTGRVVAVGAKNLVEDGRHQVRRQPGRHRARARSDKTGERDRRPDDPAADQRNQAEQRKASQRSRLLTRKQRRQAIAQRC